MTQINEYTTQLITPQEFEQWKANWQPGQEVPEQIHQYMNTIVLPSIDAELKDWTSTF